MSENDTRDRERLEELREKMQLRQLTEEDKDEAGGFKDGQEELFDLDPEEEEFDEIDKAYRGEELQWLADRGLCSGAKRSNILRARSCRSPSTSASCETTLQ